MMNSSAHDEFSGHLETWGSQWQEILGHMPLVSGTWDCFFPGLSVGGQLYWGCQISPTPAGFLLVTFCH